MDVLDDCLDEVALEGLDGITIRGLWLRLEKRQPGIRLGVDDLTKPFIWECITIPGLWIRLEKRQPRIRLGVDDLTKPFIWECLATSPQVEFYELPEPRAPLVVNDKVIKDEETGYDIRTYQNPGSDIYPISIVKASKLGERGSCATYKRRKKITGEIRTEDRELTCTLAEAVERWDNKLVLVASQSLRQEALFHDGVLPDIELTDNQYCILERLGRARRIGEIQQDIMAAFGVNSKFLFHVRKSLLQHKLITKQNFCFVAPGVSRMQASVLLLLKRFHTTHKSRNQALMEALINILQNKPDKIAVGNDLKEEMELTANTFKKICQALESQGKIKAVLVPIEEVFPDPSGPKEKGRGKKPRVVRCLQLVKTEEEDEEGDEEEAVEPEETPYPFVMELPLINQAYDFMYSRGPHGVTQQEMQCALRMGKYDARGVCRSLLICKVAVEIIEDKGKVRSARYVAKSLLDQNQLKQQLEEEQMKHKRLRNKDGKAQGKTATASTGTTTPANISEPSPALSTSTDKPADSTEEGKPAEEPVTKGATPKKQVPQTYRRLRRINIILEVIKSTKVVEGSFPFAKAIRASEEKEGFCGMLDKKSVMRLLQEMISEGQVKVIKTIVIQDGMEKPVVLYVEPSISPTDGIVKSAIEQIKFKMVRGKDGDAKKEKEQQPKKLREENTIEGDLEKTTDNVTVKKGTKKGRYNYTFKPKFARLQLAHQFLWYLVYSHKGHLSDSTFDIQYTSTSDTQSQDTTTVIKTTTSRQAQDSGVVKEAAKEAGVSQVDSGGDGDNLTPGEDAMETEERPLKDVDPFKTAGAKASMTPPHSQVYVNELSWKRFVPPIPVHGNYGPGWCLISDVLCVIPLNLFCHLIMLTWEVDGLQEYLDDPVKRYTLVRHLPNKLRQQILFKRKYMFSFYELIERLSAMGLVKIGPQRHHEKDQIFIYLNKNARIVDTTTSRPGYALVHSDEGFISRRFTFTSEREVEGYWCALEYTCLNTPLGARGLKEGQHGVTETAVARAKLLQFAKPDEDIVDDGFIPGDGRGAGGLDSVFNSHLRRNWKVSPLNKVYPRKPADRPSKAAPAAFTEDGTGSLRKPRRLPKQVYFIKMPFQSPERKSQSSSADESSAGKGKQPLVKVTKVQDSTKDRNKKVKGGKGQKRKREKKVEAPKPTKARKRKASLSSDVPPRKKATYHDTRDKAALSKMKKQRVSWTPQEDSLILLCRVASALLNKKVTQGFVPWGVVRDILYDTFQASEDKTSASVSRRSTYIMKNAQTALNFKICLAEVHQDKEFMSEVNGTRGDYTDPRVCEGEYRSVVGRLQEKFRAMPGEMDEELPETMEELLSKYKVMAVGQPRLRPQTALTSIDDVHTQVLRNFIWNCLGASERDRTKHTFLAYRLFNKYPSQLVERAFMSMKKQGLVNQSKGIGKRSKVCAVPMAAIGYQLSTIAERYFQHHIPSTVFAEAQKMMTRLQEDKARGDEEQGVEFPSEGLGGQAACLLSLWATNQLSCTVDIPENIVVIDSTVERPSEAAKKKAASKDGSDSEGDAGNPNTGMPLPTQASRAKFLAARGGSAPGILSIRNLEATDNIVVNSCTLTMRLKRTVFEMERQLFNYEAEENQLLIGDSTTVPRRKLFMTDPTDGTDPADIAPPWTDFVSICRQDFQYSHADVQRIKDVYDYIEVGQGLGVSLTGLKTMFQNAAQEASAYRTDDHINMLLRFGMCVEVGFHGPRLVTAEHCGPWFMHSSRLVSMATSPQDVTSQPESSQDVTSQPGTSQDVTSQPGTSQDMTSQPGSSQDVTSQQGTSQDMTSQPGSSQDVTSQQGTSQDMTSQPGTSQDVTSQQGTSQDVTSQPGSSQDVTSQPGTSQDMTSQLRNSQVMTSPKGTSHEVISQPGTSQDVTSQPRSSQDVTSQPGISQDVTSQPGTSQDVTSQPGSLQDVTSQPGSLQDVTSQPGSSQDVTSQPGSSQDVTSQPGSSQDVTSQPGSSQDVTSQPGSSPEDAETHPQLSDAQTSLTAQNASKPSSSQDTSEESLRKVVVQVRQDQAHSKDSSSKILPKGNAEEGDMNTDAAIPPETDDKEGNRDGRKLRPRSSKTPSPRRRRDKPGMALQIQMQTSRHGVYEPVAFLSRPWRAVDGSVNVKVLRNMLQGILLQVMTKPGISQTAMLQHIHTILPPTAVLELLQMLETFGCVTARYIRRAPKASLFSAPVSFIEGEGGDHQDVYYEPTADAVPRLNEAFSPELNQT